MVCFCAVVKSTPAPEPLSVAGVWAHTATGATHSAKTNANRWFRCMIDFKLPPGHGARHICNHRLFTSAPCKRPWMRHSRFSSATGNGLIHQGKAEATRDGAPEPPPGAATEPTQAAQPPPPRSIQSRETSCTSNAVRISEVASTIVTSAHDNETACPTHDGPHAR